MVSLLVDKTAAYTFLTEMVPQLENDEVLLLILKARKKYAPKLRSEAFEITKLLHHSDINYILNRVEQLSQVGDFYIDDKTNQPIPLSAYVLYINLLPKSVLLGYMVFQHEINSKIYHLATLPSITKEPAKAETRRTDYQTTLKKLRTLNDELISAIHRSNSRKPYLVIDVDHKDQALLLKILEQINYTYTWISETHGGYHIIISKTILTLEIGKIIYNEVSAPPDIQISEEAMTPIPGTLQGGFQVKRFEI
jgi:hypothetical protein